MSYEQVDRFWRLVSSSDEQFYEEHLMDFTDEELQKFLDENPDFMKE